MTHVIDPEILNRLIRLEMLESAYTISRLQFAQALQSLINLPDETSQIELEDRFEMLVSLQLSCLYNEAEFVDEMNRRTADMYLGLESLIHGQRNHSSSKSLIKEV